MESGNSQCCIFSGSLQALLFILADVPGQQVVFRAWFCHCLTPAHLWGSSSRFLELQWLELLSSAVAQCQLPRRYADADRDQRDL